MVDPVTFVVLVLAASRIAGLLVDDDFGPLRDVRTWVLRRWPDDDTDFYDSEVTVGDHPSEGTVTGTGVPLVAVGDSGAGMVWRAVTPTPFGRLWSCVRCMSVWSGVVVTVLAVTSPHVFWALCLPLAASEAAIRIHRVG